MTLTLPERASAGTEAMTSSSAVSRGRTRTSSRRPRRPWKTICTTRSRRVPRTANSRPRRRARTGRHGRSGDERHCTALSLGGPGASAPPLGPASADGAEPASTTTTARQPDSLPLKRRSPLFSAPPGLAVGLAQRELRYGRRNGRFAPKPWFPRITDRLSGRRTRQDLQDVGDCSRARGRQPTDDCWMWMWSW